jgi:hypothetical protein
LTALQGVERCHAVECLHELAERIHDPESTQSSDVGFPNGLHGSRDD